MKSNFLGTALLSVGATALLCTIGTSSAHAQPATDAPPSAAPPAAATPVPPPPSAPPVAAPPPPVVTAPAAPPPSAPPSAADAPVPPDPDRPDAREVRDANGEPRANEDAPVDVQPGPRTEDERDDSPGVPASHEHRDHFKPIIQPFAAIVGGAKADGILNVTKTHTSGRVSAIMIGDFGLRGQITPWASFESEIMANGGADLHGSSVYEGQAALQVRKQVLHLAKDWWVVEVGRVLDEASVDYVSSHVVDTFLEDTATRDALLFDGLNLGNGIRGTAEIVPGLRLGMAANAGNVVSTSSVLSFGGTYAPYSRVFYQAAGTTRADLNGYPDDSFQSYVFSPSILFKRQFTKYFGLETHGELQYFLVDPNEGNNDTTYLRGYNFKGNIALHVGRNNVFQPFFNTSYGKNDVVDPNDKTKIADGKYRGVSVGAGFDINYKKQYGQYDGVGIQVMQDESKTGSGTIPRLVYWNVGTSYWLSKNIALGARLSIWRYNEFAQTATGEVSTLLTARMLL